MGIAIADLHSFYRRTNSETTALRADNIIASANVGAKDYYIHQDIKMSMSHSRVNAVVVVPFVIEITSTEEGFLATSRISPVYELEATPGQAIQSYLKSLLDELVWLQDHKEELSSSILEELQILQYYVHIIE